MDYNKRRGGVFSLVLLISALLFQSSTTIASTKNEKMVASQLSKIERTFDRLQKATDSAVVGVPLTERELKRTQGYLDNILRYKSRIEKIDPTYDLNEITSRYDSFITFFENKKKEPAGKPAAKVAATPAQKTDAKTVNKKVGSGSGAAPKALSAGQAKILQGQVDKFESNLTRLEKIVDASIVGVPLTDKEIKNSDNYFKRISGYIKKIKNMDPSYNLDELIARKESFESYLDHKKQEPASTAAEEIKSIYTTLASIEKGARFRARPQFSSDTDVTKTSYYFLSSTFVTAKQKDPNYDYSQIIERFQPHARAFVEVTGRLLPHMPGSDAEVRALAALEPAIKLSRWLRNAMWESGDGTMPAAEKAKLDQYLATAEKELKAAKSAAPEYYKPQQAQNSIEALKYFSVASTRNEFESYDKQDTACQKAIVGKVAFSNETLGIECSEKDFISAYELGQPLNIRAGFANSAVNEYIKMRNHEKTLGVPGSIEIKVVYELDGKKVFSFSPRSFISTQPYIYVGLQTKYFPQTNLDYYQGFRDIVLKMVDENIRKATFGIKIYAHNSHQEVDPQLTQGPLLAQGQIPIDASTKAAKQFILKGQVGVPDPGPLHGRFAKNAQRAMQRSEIPFDVLHMTSSEATVVKNGLGLPLKIVMAGVVASKHEDNTCSSYVQWFKQTYTGGGNYSAGLSLDKKEITRTVPCIAVEQYL
ncbi:hypothetical protein FKG94_03575 [Exilibacterium tricleocarpae]|uniref:Uncharacterized protein n=1 Tax=Exilibacterium tricleocarpae TaxID=2591008 RepID=A0A545U580_9GAMM|nr:hypothetical protein [Exilibacterium tricleocarpae]TQV84614.1 hypothetical protein FKG94_03575 [Exilibacterium tricleocarpae]